MKMKHEEQQQDQQHQQNQQQQEGVVVVCCGCRPRTHCSRKNKKKKNKGFSRQQTQYEDAVTESKVKVPVPPQKVLLIPLDRSSRYSRYSDDDSEDSFYFFDAEETLLGENEYPVLKEDMTTRVLRHRDHHTKNRKLQLPSHKQDIPNEQKLQQLVPSAGAEQEEIAPLVPSSTKQQQRRINLWQKEPSQRFHGILNTSQEEMVHQIIHPPVVLEPDQGYPGPSLTSAQLDQVRIFLNLLQTMPQSVAEQVYSFRDVEDPPYTICRWLRATKWDAKAILTRCYENQTMFDDAAKHQFYPNPSQSIGAPFSLFLTQYPFLAIGAARNGCSVNYFRAGKIHPEGIMALTTADKLEGYFWWSFMHKMKDEIDRAKIRHPNYVRCEGINIIDLEGLSRSALSSETMAVIKRAGKIGDFFPETLHQMLIINAPSYFGVAWGLIKKFIDPQTARRINLYSNKQQGLDALRTLIDENQIPKEYGGTNISIQEAFREKANDPQLLRQEVQLLHVKRKSTTCVTWKLQSPQEYMDITCYTRSVSGATITIRLNDDSDKNNSDSDNNQTIVKVVENVKCRYDFVEHDNAGEVGTGVGQPRATCYTLITKLHGTGTSKSSSSNSSSSSSTITVEVSDNDNVDKQHHKHSRGYFLIVGDAKCNKNGASDDDNDGEEPEEEEAAME